VHANDVAGLPRGFTQNGLASVVDSTADFLNSAQLSPFVRVSPEMMAFSPRLAHEAYPFNTENLTQ